MINAPAKPNAEDYPKKESEKAVRDRGLANMEGREYVVKEGDCIYFRFNV